MTHSHTGWFHRSGTDQGGLHWVPASNGTGQSAGSARDGPVPDLVAGGPLIPVELSSGTPGPYPVAEVKGRRPASLDDFLGVTSFAVMKGDLTYRVFGTGHPGTGMVRFYQQDLGWDGRDTRSWTITTTPHGIVAEPDDHPPARAGPGPSPRWPR